MAKLVLNDITSTTGLTTAINVNSALIEAALENTLSRDGTSPNTMSGDLDMNSYSILNLPSPVNDGDPARKVDLTTAISTYVAHPITSAEIAAGVIPTSYAYAPGNVLRYGVNTTPGTTDMTAAFDAAVAQCKQTGGSKVFVPAGRYAANIVITGSDVEIEGEESYYDSGAAVGLCAYTAASPVISIGDGTTVTRSIRLKNLTIYATTGNDKGLRIYGAQDVYVVGCIIRGFDEYQIQIDSSATRPTLYVYFHSCHVANAVVSGSLGVDLNYGALYTTAVFVSDCHFEGNSTGSYVLDMAANCQLRIANAWIQASNGKGIHLAANTAKIAGQNVVVDSDASTDVLLTCDFDGRVPEVLYGNITVDGVATFTSGNTAALTAREYLSNEAMLLYPHVVGSLNFQDTSAANNAQHATGEQTVRISRTGSNLGIVASSGSQQNIVGTSGKFQVYKSGSSTPDAPMEVGTLAIYDGVTAPAAPTGMAIIYVDVADGDLKIKFGDGTIKTIVVDT
jgi:hypothetical protein